MLKSMPYMDESGQWIIELEAPPVELQKDFDYFFANYEIADIVFEGDTKPPLKAKATRICRFCGKSKPEVTFKMDAHTVAQQLGNRNLISDFECDACNGLFSKYESELAAFLGLSRTLSFLKGQSGIPKFKTPDKKFEVGHNTVENKIEIISEGLENDHWEINEEEKTVKFHSEKHPYTPLNVFKSLLKMGLCYIDEEYLCDFEKAFELLKTDKNDEKVKGYPLLRLYMHLVAGPPFPSTMIMCLERKKEPVKTNCPRFSFVIYSGNYILQFFMPFYMPDREIFLQEGDISVPACPPLLSKSRFDSFGIPKRGVFDLSSTEKVKNEKQVITMSYDSISYIQPS